MHKHLLLSRIDSCPCFVQSHHTNPFIKGINQPYSCVCYNAVCTSHKASWKNPSHPASFLSIGSWESGETGRTLQIKEKDLREEGKAAGPAY